MSHPDIPRRLARTRTPEQELLTGLLETSGLLVAVLDEYGCVQLFNSACEVATGLTAEHIVGQDFCTTLMPDTAADTFRGRLARLAAGGTEDTCVTALNKRNGASALIHWRIGLLPDDTHWLLCVGTDVTAQEQTAATLRRGQQDLQQLLDALQGPAVQLDRDYRIQYANAGYLAWFRLNPRTQTDRHVRDLIGHQAFNLLRPEYDRALAGMRGTFHGILPYARGGPRFIHGSYIPSRDGDNQVTGIYCLEQDLSRQERLQRALSSETVRNRTIIDEAIVGIIALNEQGFIRSFNPAAERIFGYDADTVIGQSVSMLMPEADGSHHPHHIKRYLDTGDPHITGNGRDVVGMHRDGRTLELHLAMTNILDHGERCFVGFISDITARKQAERQAQDHLHQLTQLNRRAAMSELTSDLAHEISQPLTAIRTLASAGLALQQSAGLKPEALAEMLSQINTQAGRASDIIQQVRHFLRDEIPGTPRPQDIRALIDRVLLLLQHEIQVHGVRLERNAMETLPCCRVHSVQIEQVLFNLAHNAIDAMSNAPGEHVLAFSCRHDAHRHECIIQVTDTGPGIAESDLERIFDPFFTTRPQGLGQGLSICRSIIERHGGRLTARNQPQHGALFEFTLPCNVDTETCDGS